MGTHTSFQVLCEFQSYNRAGVGALGGLWGANEDNDNRMTTKDERHEAFALPVRASSKAIVLPHSVAESVAGMSTG